MRKRGAKIVTRLGAALVVLLLAASCNSILGNADGRYVPDASTTDAADVVVAPSDADGTTIVEASDLDVLTLIDASPNDGPPSGFCATVSPTPAFCADFDELDNDGGYYGFGAAQSGNGCGVSRDVPASSAPLSLRALTTNFQVGCYLATQVTPTSSITVEADVRMHVLPSSFGAAVSLFAIHTPSTKYSLYMNHGGIAFQGNKNGQQSTSDTLFPPKLDAAFVHVQMKLTLTAGGAPVMSAMYGATTVLFGGNPQGTMPAPFDPGTTAELRVGLPEVVVTNAGDVEIDNVVVHLD